MRSLNDLLRPNGERPSKPAASLLPQRFIVQQDTLGKRREELGVTYQQQQQLYTDLLGHSHVATWNDLWPMVSIFKIILPPANLACIFGVCADVCTVAATSTQPVSTELLTDLWTLGVMVDFMAMAQTNEAVARQRHKRANCFKTKPTASLQEMMDEAAHRQASLEPRILGQLIWLKTDAVTFFPDPGQPEKGWRDAYAFFWGYQRLSPAIRNQLDPCQLLVARLAKK